MQMKKCSKCGIEKPLTEFHKNKKSKDGHENRCKTCKYAEMKRWKSLPEVKESIRQQVMEYRARPEIKERIKQQSAEYRAQNKEKIAEYRAQNKERIAEYYAQNKAEQPACIYQIKNVLSNKIYIGETIRGEHRWRDHLWGLRANRHSNYNLQQDFNEHGEEAFVWSIVKELPKDKDTLLLEEAREIERRIDRGEDLYNLILTIEQVKMLKENA
jgi:hypothetical protein